MPQSEYIGVDQVNGPFVLMENVGKGAFYGELVDVRVPGGKVRRGRVVSLSEKATLVQVFSGTDIPIATVSKGFVRRFYVVVSCILFARQKYMHLLSLLVF